MKSGPLKSLPSVNERLRTAIQIIVLADSKTKAPSSLQLHSPHQPDVSIGSNSDCSFHIKQQRQSNKDFNHQFCTRQYRK